MLPKLQQSSLAQSLRRDNLASQIQCTHSLIQARTNSKASSENKTTNAINHGRTITHPKIHIRPSETSPGNIYPRRKSKKYNMSQFTNLHSPAPSPNIQDIRAQEEKLPAPFKRKASFKSLYPNLGPSRKDRSQPHNLEDTTTVVICPSE